MPRAFLGIGLSSPVRGLLGSCRDAFLGADPAWRAEKWVPPANLHVTLRFLGTVADADLATIADVTRDACRDIAPYRLDLDAVRAIPRPRAASMLWVGAETGHEQTAQLVAALDAALVPLGHIAEERAFKTHVTLCRARHPRRVETAALFEIERVLHAADERARTMSVRSVTLYASTLSARGAIYEELVSFPVGG